MTCFWDAILKAIKSQSVSNDLPKIFTKKRKPSPKNLILFLKNNNIRTDNVLWCSQELSEKEKDENYKFIASYHFTVIAL